MGRIPVTKRHQQEVDQLAALVDDAHNSEGHHPASTDLVVTEVRVGKGNELLMKHTRGPAEMHHQAD